VSPNIDNINIAKYHLGNLLLSVDPQSICNYSEGYINHKHSKDFIDYVSNLAELSGVFCVYTAYIAVYPRSLDLQTDDSKWNDTIIPVIDSGVVKPRIVALSNTTGFDHDEDDNVLTDLTDTVNPKLNTIVECAKIIEPDIDEEDELLTDMDYGVFEHASSSRSRRGRFITMCNTIRRRPTITDRILAAFTIFVNYIKSKIFRPSTYTPLPSTIQTSRSNDLWYCYVKITAVEKYSETCSNIEYLAKLLNTEYNDMYNGIMECILDITPEVLIDTCKIDKNTDLYKNKTDSMYIRVHDKTYLVTVNVL
jgi:hypothetical protein